MKYKWEDEVFLGTVKMPDNKTKDTKRSEGVSKGKKINELIAKIGKYRLPVQNKSR